MNVLSIEEVKYITGGGGGSCSSGNGSSIINPNSTAYEAGKIAGEVVKAAAVVVGTIAGIVYIASMVG